MTRFVPFASAVLMLTGLLCSSCSESGLVPSASNMPPSTIQIVERDAGIIEDALIDYDFLVGGVGVRNIASVSASCGCTQVSLRRGDQFDYSKHFHVNIQLHKNQWGKGRQDFFVKFTDGTALEGRLAYEYSPPPFVIPEELLFFEDVNEKEMIFCFPNESMVAIQEIAAPTGITWKREPKDEKMHEVRLVFEIDRSLFEGEPTGTIEVLTTSRKKPRFSLPYLVLQP